jgi:hypothetical protein
MIKLRVLAEPTLTLGKERKTLPAGAEIEVSEERAKEILDVTFKGKPVAEIVEEQKEIIDDPQPVEDSEITEKEFAPKKEKNKKYQNNA